MAATKLRDITKFPHAQGRVERALIWEDIVSYAQAMDKALRMATATFIQKYDRPPDFDNVRFRGSTTTFHVVMEIWEE